MKNTMNNQSNNRAKKAVAAISIAVIALTLVIQQNTLGNLFRMNIANAMVYKSGESDPLATDITSPICDPNSNQSHSDVATDDNRRYAIAWEDDTCDGAGNGTGIYVERYDGHTGPNPATGGPERVNQTLLGDQKNPSIAMDYVGNYVVAWNGSGTGDADGIYVRVFNSDGTPRGPEHLVNTHTTGVQDSAKVAIDFDAHPVEGQEGHFAVAWHGEGDGDTEGIYMQRFNMVFGGDIETVGANVLVNTYTDGAQVAPDIAMTNDDLTNITWSGPGTGYTTTSEVWMQGFDPFGAPWNGAANNIRVNSTSPADQPAIAANKSNESSASNAPGGTYVIVYRAGADHQIYGKLVDACSNQPGACPLGNVELNINGTTSNLPDVAMDYLGNFTVTWEQDDTPGGQNVNIHGINYDYLGHRIDSNFRVNDNVYSDGSANQTDSAVAKNKNGEYVVTWTSPHSTQGDDIRYKKYGTDIFKSGQETIAHVGTADYGENTVSTAIAPNGNRAVVFVGQEPGFGPIHIYYSLYDSSNNIIVQNQMADTSVDSSVNYPSVSFFKDTQGTDVGRFVIAWAGNDPVTLSTGHVLYREIDPAGTPSTLTELIADSAIGGDTFLGVKVKAGYYNDTTPAVIDRFAIAAQKSMSGNESDIVGIYHTETGFTENTLSTCSLGSGCGLTTTAMGIDMYPDIGGNDKIIYTWDENHFGAGNDYFVYGREANNGTLVDSNFQINNGTTVFQGAPDVAFVSPSQYVATWTVCNNSDCVSPGIYASRYNGNFSTGAPTVTDDDFAVYPANGDEQSLSAMSKIAGDTNNGSFIITWTKDYNDMGHTEIYGKFFTSAVQLANFGVGFMINSTPDGNHNNAAVAMNNAGKAIVGWEGNYAPSGVSVDANGAVFQVLNNPTFVETIPELPTAAQLTIEPGGKTLTIPSNIQFPTITASTSTNTEVEREIDENPSVGQPLNFQLEDLGGNPSLCETGTCYSLTVTSTDFTYTDSATGQTYAVPASGIFIKNYDGNHSGVVGTGICGSPESGQSFEILSGNASDFLLDSGTCDYASLDVPRTIMNKTSNTSDTAKIQLYPKLKINVPALTPPGTYTGTITITAA